MNSTTPQTDWSSIPDDILTSIAGKIVSADDYVSFSAVCRYWYSLAADHHNNHKPTFQPLFTPGINPGSKTIKFRNPTTGKALTVDLPPEIAGTTRFWGSPFGWLIACDRSSCTLSLFNPFTGATISLPNYPDAAAARWNPPPDEFNVFLTANPDSDPDNCLVVLHPGDYPGGRRNVTFLRLGRDSWRSTRLYSTDDFTYFNGFLYGVHLRYHGYVSFYRLNPHDDDDGDIIKQFLDYKPFHEHLGNEFWTQTHVFVLKGELCLCVRHCYYGSVKAEDIRIFRIDPSNGDLTPVTSLGDQCLFLGSNYSFACRASYPLGDGEGEELASDLVFFSYRRGLYYKVYYNYPFDVEVWDMACSRRVCRMRVNLSPLSESLWIVSSLTMFRKLEDISAPTPDQ